MLLASSADFFQKYILKDFNNASPYYCTFLENRICDLKVTRRFKCATQNWYASVVNLTALKRDDADDVTWEHAASSNILQSQLKLLIIFMFKLWRV